MEELITAITRRRGNRAVPVEKGAKKGEGGAGETSKGAKKGGAEPVNPNLDEEESKYVIPVPLYLLPRESSSVEWQTTNPTGAVSPRRFVRDEEGVK